MPTRITGAILIQIMLAEATIPLPKSEIIERAAERGTNISDADWIAIAKSLIESQKISQQGVKRGATYTLS